ncbi:diguanylate cyclase (GGDEF) domain-containing protein [Desulfitobacterium dehalogenans ATCC 51507]|uniref:Diguanylate cyclase (GGDEF) domain-containing protein n=1 Tax=Desulfitobacterium dehalogenans (strain ATCC 51507 / DSM 9161 / JW/IU-DC1) TaxID=756499 RepID=I4A6K7_DESDJ|nr:bifunctional diguanylate cyclase/phosphodiesterase [Desulfitobacterium dehalogenans]AFL99591.1 diguanylate cyclase (GGDEF) domain-containing protein [Desulfitobacterium dehalogenans ATCC 51507]
MIRTSSAHKEELSHLLQGGYSLWILYLDIAKFHEVEFRQGYRVCAQILDEVVKEMNHTLHNHLHLFHTILLDYQGGDDFIFYFSPTEDTPWSISELVSEFVPPLESRINKRIQRFVQEALTLHAGLVECNSQPGRSVDYLLYGALKEAFLLNKSEPDPLYFPQRKEVDRILEDPDHYVHSAFQPILDVISGEFFGFEALARLKQPSSFTSIADLFPFADKIGKLYPVETICRRTAIANSSQILRSNEFLFLNVEPQVITDPEFSSGQTRKLLDAQGLTPSDVVLEITERSAIENYETFREALEHYRKQGYLIALDDVGAGYSSLQSIAELHPDFLKIDRSLIQGIHLDPTKWALLETFVTFSRRIGCRILAEGVETPEEMQTVVQLGVDYVQGYFIAKPSFTRPELKDQVSRIVNSHQRLSFNSEKTVLNILEPLPLVAPQTTVNVVKNYFEVHSKVWLVGVADQGVLLGVVQRDKLYTALATPYGVSLYSQRPITSLMNNKHLLIEETTPIEVASSLAMARSDAHLYDGIVVVQQQKPIGMIRVASLIKAMSDTQIQIARGASPLTGLPGNIAIEQQLKLRLAGNKTFGIIYADLNQFKLFNDTYGFQHGDSIIKILGELLVQESQKIDPHAFTGHVGGDDFVILSNDSNIRFLGEHLLSHFQQRIESIYGAKDLSLALAGLVVDANSSAPLTATMISEELAVLKKEAKYHKGNYLILKDYKKA